MRTPEEGPSGSSAEREDMERMAGSTGSGGEVPSSTGGMPSPGSSGMPQTGGGTYQQPGARTQPAASYGQGTAPARPADYRTAESGEREPSRHGAALAILAGALAFLEGLAFVIRSSYYHVLPGYAYRWSLHGWGWVLLVLGAVLLASGVSHLLGIKGSRQFAAAVAVLTAVVAFLTIFYSVIWGVIVVAACAFAANSLLSDRGMAERYPADTGYGAGGQGYESMSQGQQGEAMSRGQGSHRRG